MAGKISKSPETKSPICKCDLCLRFHNINISWTCLDCEEILCDSCKATHQRGKATKTHKIVTTIEARDARERGVRAKARNKGGKGLVCDQHKEEEYQFHCNTCYQPICASCVVGPHKLHDFLKLEDFIENGKEKIFEDIVYLKEESIPLLKENSDICVQKHCESERELADALAILNSISNKVENETRRITGNIKDELRSIHSQNETNIMNSKRAFDSVTKSVIEAVKKSEEGPMGSFRYIYESNERLENARALLQTPKLPHVNHIAFYKGEVDAKTLQKMIGIGSKTYETEVVDMTKLHESGSENSSGYTICRTGISAVAIVNDNTAMIREPGTARGIQRVKIKDDLKLDISESTSLPQIVNDLCSFNQKVTLVTLVGKTSIKMVHSDGKVTTFTDLKPLFPIGLSKSSNGEILITVVESDVSKITEKSSRAVFTLSYSGRILKKIEFYKGNRIFTRPYKVIENHLHGDLLVIDFLEVIDRVVCLNRDGKEIFSYTGNICPKYPRLLAAQGIACDKDSNVYISDARNYVIHVVNPEGNFLKFVENEMERFYSPWALAVDEKNRLWVGSSNGNMYLIDIDDAVNQSESN